MMTECRQLSTAELPLLQPLFEEVFKVPFDLPLMEWKYGAGRGAAWTLWREGGPTVHCGLLFRRVIFQGRTVLAAQLVDLMARRKENGLSRQASPFARLMHQLLDALPGADNPDGLAFGFPSNRAMRLGESLGVYAAVDQLLELSFLPRRSWHSPGWRPWTAGSVAQEKLADACWHRLRRDMAGVALGVRDTSYLAYRYCQHPSKTYALLQVLSRWRRTPLGLVVIAPGQQGDHEIVDLLGAWEDMPEMLLAAQAWLAETGGKRLRLSLTARFARQLAPFADDCLHTEFRIMANPKMPADQLAALTDGWWLTGGDTDYR